MRRKCIGMKLSTEDSDIDYSIVRIIVDICKQKNINILIIPGRPMNIGEFQYQCVAMCEHIRKDTVDCLISVSGINRRYCPVEKRISRDVVPDFPVITIFDDTHNYPAVVSDVEAAMTELIFHLVTKHGCRKFNFVTGPADDVNSNLQLTISRNILNKNGIDLSENRIYADDYREESGRKAMEYFAKNGLLDCDAVIVFDDTTALGVLNYAEDFDIKIPEDLIVTGFDDIQKNYYGATPTITSVNRNLTKIGEFAVDLAIRSMNGEKIPECTKIPCTVHYRQSCGCVRSDDNMTNYVDSTGEGHKFQNFRDTGFAKRFFNLEHDLSLLRMYLSNMCGAIKLDQNLENLRSAMPLFKISSCVIVLYSSRIERREGEAFNLPSSAKLVFVYDYESTEAECKLIEQIVFDPSHQMLPEGLLSNRWRVQVIKPLFFCAFQLGYVIYEPGNMSSLIYNTFFTQLSTIINSAQILSESEKAKKRLSFMLNRIAATNGELSNLTTTDELTGLYNRRGLLTVGKQVIELALMQKKNGMVIFADMDGLKIINDTYGHDAGDTAIKLMGKFLRSSFRDMDVVGRVGGDEFVIVASSINLDFLSTIRDRLEKNITEYQKNNDLPFRLSISMGGVEFSEEQHDLELLLSFADKLLYEEKSLKRNSRTYQEKQKDGGASSLRK